MKYIKGFFAFWYDFIVGDAWEVAAGVLLTLIVLYLLVNYISPSFSTLGALIFPVVIAILLGYSLWRVRDSG
jgi:predicted benzoate:H+ symporter BenE